MPRLTATAALQLVLLLSAVPAQYLISRWSGSTAAQRFHSTARYGWLMTTKTLPPPLVRLEEDGACCNSKQHCYFRLLRHWNHWRASYLNSTVWMDWAHQQMVKVQYVCDACGYCDWHIQLGGLCENKKKQ